MTDTLTKTLRSSFLILAFSLMFSFNTSAQTCGTPPTCESLGYDKTSTQCRGVSYVKCPFDTAKVFCNIPLKVGDILYSDMTYSAEKISGKTPIGIIFDTVNRSAIALSLSTTTYPFSTKTPDGLSHYNINAITEYIYNGKGLTKILLGYSGVFPGAEYSNTYSTTGTTKGEWYVPGFGQLYSVFNNLTAINKSLAIIGKPKIGYDSSVSGTVTGSVMSSNRAYANDDSGTTQYGYAAIIWLGEGFLKAFTKRDAKSFVLPVLNF